MDIHEAAPRLLAASGAGQQVLDLRDGTVRLDVGPTSLRFSYAEFGTLAGMIEAARLRTDTPENGLLAYDGARCGIWRCAQHGTLALVVDRAIVRVAAPDVALVAALCRQAVTTLGRNGTPHAYDHARPAHTRA